MLRESCLLEELPSDIFDEMRQSLVSVMVSEALPFLGRQIAYAGKIYNVPI